ncbi:NADH-quinone oxidoreductase subunit A [bacterium]|nr:NADH-quinone oxidoreductase subunit A [bacterium]
MLAPYRPGRTKNETYECGLEARGDSWIQFRVQYYVIALAFLIFDLEAVFLFPAAMVLRERFVEQSLSLGLLAAVEIVLFVAILAIGLVYAWAKKLLEWN